MHSFLNLRKAEMSPISLIVTIVVLVAIAGGLLLAFTGKFSGGNQQLSDKGAAGECVISKSSYCNDYEGVCWNSTAAKSGSQTCAKVLERGDYSYYECGSGEPGKWGKEVIVKDNLGKPIEKYFETEDGYQFLKHGGDKNVPCGYAPL